MTDHPAVRRTVALAALGLSLAAGAVDAQGAPQVERPIPFDAAGRVMVLTPTQAARWKLAPPPWPLGTDWREARLYEVAGGGAVLVAQRVDGAVARHVYTADELARLREAINTAITTLGAAEAEAGAATGFELSQPAGNVFVRNQVLLGLFAYGPATAALLSNSGGAAAGGGYLVAAGASYFVAAQTIRTRSVTRAQASLASHGGTRGGLAGAAIAAIANADGGPGYGAPILAGAIGGTIAGFRAARGLSDGEAATSGLGADLAALTTLGVGGALGAFEEKETRPPPRGEPPVENSGPEPKAKVALGSAVATGLVGYLVGPRYARGASYNVTAGDVSMIYSAAALGALASNAAFPDDGPERTGFALATAGVLGGAVLADRVFVKRADRTHAEGTLAQLGAAAGGLMGGGVALMSKAERQPAVALIAAGGAIGLVLADRLIAPARDAGAKRGVFRSSDAGGGRADTPRWSLSLVPAAATLGMAAMRDRGTGVVRAEVGRIGF
jgi:hypothetical protein